MLTVIIHKKSSQQFIDKYRPLFEPYLEAGKIAFCFWDEHGTDIKSAVPELAGIVRGIERWKAIIVDPLISDDSEMPAEAFCRENPFDFLCNLDPEPVVHESHIPLIRLAQMLGGVPLVNQHYSHVMETDKNNVEIGFKIQRMEQEEFLLKQQKIWDELNDKYSFNCEYPSKLYLFSARNLSDINLPKITDVEQFKRHESDSSLFWYRNRYPAKARFLVQDCTKPGHAHYYQDLFCFWMTVLTLALNNEPPGTFEAYKLYHVKCEVEKNKIHSVFSDYYNRLSSIQFSANKQIIELQKEVPFNREIDELPLYEREIPIKYDLKEDEDLIISSKKIGFSGDCPIKEEPWWYAVVEKSRLAVTKLYRSIRRVLDLACMQCRYGSKVVDEEIHQMDEYQYEEMDIKLSELEREILTFSTFRVLPMNQIYAELDRTKRSAATSMRKRMTRNLTIGVGIFTMLMYLIGFIPDFIRQYSQSERPGMVALLAMAGLPIIILVSICCLIYFRKIIKNKIGDYNAVIYQFLDNMRLSSQAFSDYLSKCCSYMRGRYMLQMLDSRAMVSQNNIKMYSRHVSRLEDQLNIIKNWLIDFELDVLPDKTGTYGRSDFDFEIPPEKNREYLIQLDNYNLDIPFDDGSIYLAPYPFVTGFHVRRVPVFEIMDRVQAVQSETYADDDRKGSLNYD